jgi:hypothetical protein
MSRVETSASDTPAHDVTATVAPFRAWRGSQFIIAKEPTEISITAISPLQHRAGLPFERGDDYVGFHDKLHEGIP